MNSTEQTTALTLIQQHLMHRRSPSGAYQYEQLTVYFDNATGDYVSHWYTGRSRHTMERRAEASYALESLMETRVANFVSQGEADGFEYVDRIVETFADVPFSRFLGARLAPLSLSTLKSSPGWLDPNNTVLVPYVSGVHVCIRIGMQDAFSLQCMNDRGDTVTLTPQQQKYLRNMIRLTEYETFVVEAILTPQQITLLDLLCVNGVALTWPYLKRMKTLSKLTKDPHIFKQLLHPDSVNVFEANSSERMDPHQRPPSGYAVKSRTLPVDLSATVVTPVIEQNYILRVFPSHLRDADERTLRQRGLKKLNLNVVGSQSICEVVVPLNQELPSLIKLDGIKNGKIINPRPFFNRELSEYLRSESGELTEILKNNWTISLLDEINF